MPLAAGFDPREAAALIAMLANLEGPTPPLAMPALPAGWTLVFDSPVLGDFDNKWQLWRGADDPPTFAVVIRGTVAKARSILDDVLSVMIRGSGSLAIDSLRFSYRFAADPQATVHLGFALAALVLLHEPRDGILPRLLDACPSGSDLLIAGHSQGAAVAALCRSYLEHAESAGPRWRHRTYLFAQPKPGNDHYGYDFDRLTGQPPSAWRFTNTLDWVPQVPLTFELLGALNEPNPLDLLTEPERALVHMVESVVRALHEHTSRAQLENQKPRAAHLAQIMRAQRPVPTAAAETPFDVGIVWDFNFCGCGIPVVLEGTPGTNPNDAHDSFWQHHAAMYYDLLRKTYL
jgi:Lipase (class 3)